ncbi:hypothetical protein PR048_022155 [Dryococelus australis]|uniref:BED-type domain-containing protein n=1 Tax=Dryococelus australis TaxID=614101 RepID=A0ABQ9H0A9_9NEOP|nr:hypothetical protein PR048_022155 [Dryococelus australis]
MGFTETNDGRSLCVICGNVFTNSSMFPAKLWRHFEGNHPDILPKSYLVARSGEAHTIAETLIKPCTIYIVECMFDEKTVQLSLQHSFVHDMVGDVKETLVSCIKCTKFALQTDESTDVTGLALLMVFV